MTKRWFVEDHANQPHLWEEDTTVFDWLKSQLDPDTGPSSVSQVREAVWIWTRNELSSGLNRLWNKVGLLSLRRKKKCLERCILIESGPIWASGVQSWVTCLPPRGGGRDRGPAQEGWATPWGERPREGFPSLMKRLLLQMQCTRFLSDPGSAFQKVPGPVLYANKEKELNSVTQYTLVWHWNLIFFSCSASILTIYCKFCSVVTQT